jgi:endonuclease-3 related protein
MNKQDHRQEAERCVGKNWRRAYSSMREYYGHQHWWPGETPFEVCVGAILTQNTNWTNVEKAIRNLKVSSVLAPEKLYALQEKELAALIRPSGFFNIKARRLRAFLKVLCLDFCGNIELLFDGTRDQVRQRLLDINGIGPETADSMLLYAGGHASFVIDAYTKRIFARHGWCDKEIEYESLREQFEKHLHEDDLGKRIDLWQDYHAQLVNIGKYFCHKKMPLCISCPLGPMLPDGGDSINNNNIYNI